MYYADNKIDKLIRETFFPDFDYKGVMVEVGAGPTLYATMSKHFRDNGWRAICLEPNPKFISQHRELGNEIYEYACSSEDGTSTFTIVSTPWWHEEENDECSHSSLGTDNHGFSRTSHQITVETIKLDTLLERLQIDHVDYLSVDVEGHEIGVMKGFDIKKYKPKVVVLESISGNSCEVYMDQFGYELYLIDNGVNQIYVKNEKIK